MDHVFSNNNLYSHLYIYIFLQKSDNRLLIDNNFRKWMKYKHVYLYIYVVIMKNRIHVYTLSNQKVLLVRACALRVLLVACDLKKKKRQDEILVSEDDY